MNENLLITLGADGMHEVGQIGFVGLSWAQHIAFSEARLMDIQTV